MKKKALTAYGQRALDALHEASAEVIEDRRRRGEPIIVWRDGKLVHEPADMRAVAEEGGTYRTSDTQSDNG